jgi:uncharacterized protein (TIGR00297 family)
MNIVSFSSSIWLIIILIVAAAVASYILGKLTLAASVIGVIAALWIYLGAGILGLAMLAAFFFLGTAVTSCRKEYKTGLQLAEANGGKRNVGQVLANAGVALILSALNLVLEVDGPLLLVMIAGSFASATGDTFSSELGNLYGRNFCNILTLRKDQRGLNGVISLEGTLFGVLGSLLIALIYIIGSGWSFAFFAILISGIAGNLFDSLLGALFERKGKLGNDAVNFLNTAVAALLALVLIKV